MENYFEKHISQWMIVLCAITFITVHFAPVTNAESDSFGTLVTSQALINFGTTKLPKSYYEVIPQYQLGIAKGQQYYAFPLGTSVYAIPFVWLANLRGEDMTIKEQNMGLQKTLAAIILTALCVVVYLISKFFLNEAYSLFLTVSFVLGSSLVSTMGTALWSINLAVLFISLSLLLLLHYDFHHKQGAIPYVIGFLLFSAYLCRPTSAIFIVLVFLYSLFKDKLFFLKIAVTSGLLLCFFVLFSLFEYGQILPNYYFPSRVAGSKTFWLAMYGNLLSPARGIIIYNPYLIITLLGTILFFKLMYRDYWLWFALIWFTLHLVVVSRFGHWWGGWSFGSRLLADAFPALILLTLLVWNKALEIIPYLPRRITIGIFAFLSLISIFINTHQGLYNTSTKSWNALPNIDHYPEYLFDWNYPQFLASPQLLAERKIAHQNKRRTKTKLILPEFNISLGRPDGWSPYLYSVEDKLVRWMSTTSNLSLPITENDKLFLSFFAPSDLMGAELLVSFDGAEPSRMTVSSGWQSTTISIPAPLLQESESIAVQLQVLLPEPTGSYAIGTTGVNSPVSIIAESSGMLDGDTFARLYVNGTLYDWGDKGSKRGYNLLAIDPISGKILDGQSFDTHRKGTENDRMLTWVEGLAEGTIVAGAVQDEGSAVLNDTGVAALQLLACAIDLRGYYRKGHAFIGVKGAERGSIVERAFNDQELVLLGSDRQHFVLAVSKIALQASESTPE